jgi:hypothetical protein
MAPRAQRGVRSNPLSFHAPQLRAPLRHGIVGFRDSGFKVHLVAAVYDFGSLSPEVGAVRGIGARGIGSGHFIFVPDLSRCAGSVAVPISGWLVGRWLRHGGFESTFASHCRRQLCMPS